MKDSRRFSHRNFDMRGLTGIFGALLVSDRRLRPMESQFTNLALPHASGFPGGVSLAAGLFFVL